MKFRDNEMDYGDIIICNRRGDVNFTQTSAQIINGKYFDGFNFYFSKPTNEMIVNVETPEVIQFKDYLYYDDINEFLKRPYAEWEAKTKLKSLAEYFDGYKDLRIPCLTTIDQRKIMNKRNGRLLHYHEKNQNLQGSQSRIDHKQVKEEVEISNPILTTKFQDQLMISNQGLASKYSNETDHPFPNESFETQPFDIYAPNYSLYSSFGDHIDKYADAFESNKSLASNIDFGQFINQS